MKEEFIDQNDKTNKNESNKEKLDQNKAVIESSNSSEIKNNVSKSSSEEYSFGWGQYSEITNGRFAMIGFAAIILIEIFSKQSFLDWAGIIH